MMRSLLAERFKLKIHREKKDTPVYALVVGKNGPRLKQSAPNSTSAATVSNGLIIFSRVTLPALAYNLSQLLDRPVIDRTALSELNSTQFAGSSEVCLCRWRTSSASEESFNPLFNSRPDHLGPVNLLDY